MAFGAEGGEAGDEAVVGCGVEGFDVEDAPVEFAGCEGFSGGLVVCGDAVCCGAERGLCFVAERVRPVGVGFVGEGVASVELGGAAEAGEVVALGEGQELFDIHCDGVEVESHAASVVDEVVVRRCGALGVEGASDGAEGD